MDIDNGYGSKLNALRAVTELARIGAYGVCIEDTLFPKRNSLNRPSQHPIRDHDEFACLVSELTDRANAEGIVIVARTEALIAGLPIQDALDRALLYDSAGADFVLVHTRDSTGGQARQVADALGNRLRLVAVPTKYPQLDACQLGRLGYQMVIYANHLLRASILAMRSAAETLGSGGWHKEDDALIASLQDVFALTDDSDAFQG